MPKSNMWTRRRLCGRPKAGRVRVPRRRRRGKRRIYFMRSHLLGCPVVIKTNTDVAEARRESAAMRAYGDSPNLVRLYRFYVRRGRGCIVMELVRGLTVRALVRRAGALRVRTAAGIALGILRGLEALHRAGWIHGDLHCGNVIVSRGPERVPTIIDLQLAVPMREDGTARAARRLPRPEAHLPPETRRWRIDAAYDIYGVGFILACMLKGRELRRRPAAVRPRAQCKPLWAVVLKATHPVPARRYRSAAEMAQAVEEAVAQMERARPEPSGEAASPTAVTRRATP